MNNGIYGTVSENEIADPVTAQVADDRLLAEHFSAMLKMYRVPFYTREEPRRGLLGFKAFGLRYFVDRADADAARMAFNEALSLYYEETGVLDSLGDGFGEDLF